jgi:hypothetical protein
MLEAIIKRLKSDRRGVSNVIVVMLSLILIVVIVANVVLWSYQMNQFDWERIQENTVISDVARITNSSWFVAQNEYMVNMGSRISGTYTDTQAIDGGFETFREGLITFEHGCAFKSSDTRVSTTSGIPVNDSEAVFNISLETGSYIFIIYNAGNKEGSAEDQAGKGCAINVDGEDKAFSWQSPYATDSADSVTVVWATYLSVGSHTIQGKFFANRAGYTVGIDTRQIMVYWFPTVVAEYVRSTVSVTTISSTPVDDNEAVLNITLAEDSVAFMIYNAGNKRGSAEPQKGKGITLNIDDSDIATKEWQSGYGFQDANSVTIVYAALLTTGSHTVKGRFFSNSGQTTTIDERQLIVFCFQTDTVTYGFKESTTSVSTASGNPVNDTEAILSTTLTTSSDSLVIYVGGNPDGTSECREGKGTLVNIDGVDKLNSSSWQSQQAVNYVDSVTSLWSEQMAAGPHTIQGRFFSNNPGSSAPTVTISHRQLLILAFPKSSANYRLDLNDTFTVDFSTYSLDYIETVEIQLRCRANDTLEKWYLKAYNWTALGYSDSGFNNTSGHTPTTGWDMYAVNLTDKWRSYVSDSGTMYVKLQDNQADVNQTTIDIDFLAVRVVIDGTKFTFQNRGSLTSHLVSLWVNNSTHRQRYDVNIFVNSGHITYYIRGDISLPNKPYVVKVVTERGNTAVFTSHQTE